MRSLLVLPLVLLPLAASSVPASFASPAKEATLPTPPPAPPDLDKVPADAVSLGIGGFYAKQLDPPTAKGVVSEGDYVRIRYDIWASPGGKLVDWVAPPGTVVTPLNHLVDGLRVVLLQMQPGERRRIWIPESLGAAGRVPAGGHLVVDVGLVEILHPPPAPPNVSWPPSTAAVTKSGLAYLVLKPGDGDKHPGGSSTVRVNYSGWTTEGKLVDSSVIRGEPAEFSLDAVIPGWREGLALMTEGEKARFWIPGDLAYDEQPGKPHGMLVFDVELLKIVR